MSRHILLPSMIVLILITTGIGSYAWVSHHRLPQSPGPVEKITLGTDRSLLSAPIWLAEHQGYFRDAGLEVTIKEFQTGRSALLAILHGEPIDIITVASTPIMLESFGRDDFRIIATSVDSQDNDKVIAYKESGIVTVADLLAACRRELFDHRLRCIVHLAHEQKISNRRLRSHSQFHRHVARMSAA